MSGWQLDTDNKEWPMTKRAASQRGFTLIELLIVVAIIAILAAIAVPNFLEAQIRSKVARSRADMRTIALAMETYFVDWNAYPLHADFIASVPWERQYCWWTPLTTPVAYMTLVPRDVFQNIYRARLASGEWLGFIHYEPLYNTWDGYMGDSYGPYVGFVPEMRARGVWYILISLGPDGLGQMGGYLANDMTRNPARTRGEGMAVFYDPTNGTVSYGDIVRFGPGSSDYIRW